jgi:hypothetical protein
MADQKISELTELTSAIAVTDLLAVVDSSESETKKITLANLPLTIAQFASSVPYTVDIQNGVEQNLTRLPIRMGMRVFILLIQMGILYLY